MLTEEQSDVLTELVNVGIGRAACSLSEMVHAGVGLRVPHVRSGTMPDAVRSVLVGESSALSFVTLDFTGPASGAAVLAFPRASSRALVALLIEASSDEAVLDAECEGVLTEVGNVIINGVIGALGNLTAHPVHYDLPRYSEGDAFAGALDGSSVVVVDVVFSIEGHAIDGQLAVVFEEVDLGRVFELLDPRDATSAA